MAIRKSEPNYEILFHSTVTALQIAYSSYKEARIKEMQMTWFGDDGSYVELEGVGKVRIAASEFLHEVNRLKGEVDKCRNLMEGVEDEL